MSRHPNRKTWTALRFNSFTENCDLVARLLGISLFFAGNFLWRFASIATSCYVAMLKNFYLSLISNCAVLPDRKLSPVYFSSCAQSYGCLNSSMDWGGLGRRVRHKWLRVYYSKWYRCFVVRHPFSAQLLLLEEEMYCLNNVVHSEEGLNTKLF